MRYCLFLCLVLSGCHESRTAHTEYVKVPTVETLPIFKSGDIVKLKIDKVPMIIVYDSWRNEQFTWVIYRDIQGVIQSRQIRVNLLDKVEQEVEKTNNL